MFKGVDGRLASVRGEVIAVAVGWYLRCGLSYRGVAELPAERGIEVDNVAVDRWLQALTFELTRKLVAAATCPATGGWWTRRT